MLFSRRPLAAAAALHHLAPLSPPLLLFFASASSSCTSSSSSAAASASASGPRGCSAVRMETGAVEPASAGAIWSTPSVEPRTISVGKEIFCNRSLNMRNITAVGFDMDYTLAQYKPETFEALAYHGTIEKLVKDLGYPEEMFGVTVPCYCINRDISRYINEDLAIVPMLEMIRKSGRSTFLVTNSLWDYTDVVMNYLCGPYTSDVSSGHNHKWLGYFDVVITGSSKPGFFHDGNRAGLFEVEPDSGKLLNADLHIGSPKSGQLPSRPIHKIYQGGNVGHLHRLLSVASSSQILYVGDHIYGDILRSKKVLGWRTMLVIPELEQEVKLLSESKSTRKTMYHFYHDSPDLLLPSIGFSQVALSQIGDPQAHFGLLSHPQNLFDKLRRLPRSVETNPEDGTPCCRLYLVEASAFPDDQTTKQDIKKKEKNPPHRALTTRTHAAEQKHAQDTTEVYDLLDDASSKVTTQNTPPSPVLEVQDAVFTGRIL
uniref:5'-nucleotidase n=1 Tax=Leersia perrieri TaxID=77586 RepID=A0A0D9VZK8_9ORYZ